MEYQLIVPRIPLDKELTAVEQVLANRGIYPEHVDHYINTTDEDIVIERGERPCSLLFTSCYGVNFLSSDEAQIKRDAFEGSRGAARENSSGK